LALPRNNAAEKGQGRYHVVGVYVKWFSKKFKVIFLSYGYSRTLIIGCKCREQEELKEEEVHIAVGKNTKKEEPNIRWAAANFPKATIVLVHVHWPSEWMPFSKIFIYICSHKSLNSIHICSLKLYYPYGCDSFYIFSYLICRIEAICIQFSYQCTKDHKIVTARR